jgi:RNA polymerase sigma factor (sigma-70 family)
MNNAAASALAVTQALNSLAREDRGRLLSALIARLRDFQLAEDCLQEAMVSAVSHWSRNGVPASPKGWLLQVAYRKAIDRIRQKKSEAKFGADIKILRDEEIEAHDMEAIPDNRLSLIFTCCHPALESKSQVALTLRTLGGLSTGEIARAFLDQETTMGQRLSRAKSKIAAARIPYAVPGPDEWSERLQSVLSVVYLIFNAGYSAGPVAGLDLAQEAIFLARLLTRLRPGDAEIEGCLALMFITHARRDARTDAAGASISLGVQDRSLWKRDEIAEGLKVIDTAILRRQPGPFQIKAAIAACHSQGETSDWPQILALYRGLLRYEPTPIVRLNMAVAAAETGELKSALAELAKLEEELIDYQPFHAARAEFLARDGQKEAARTAYSEAIRLSQSAADVAFLEAKRRQVS